MAYGAAVGFNGRRSPVPSRRPLVELVRAAAGARPALAAPRAGGARRPRQRGGMQREPGYWARSASIRSLKTVHEVALGRSSSSGGGSVYAG